VIVAVIPARGGSRRIPRKNIRAFAGKPVIAYSIAAARDCGLFARIIVSTDDEEIATVARACGAEAPFVRPAHLSDDHTGTNAVTAHALDWLAGRGQAATLACCIYATAPFISPADLRRGHEVLTATGKGFVFSVARFAVPIQHALRVLPDDGVEAFFPEWVECRSQDLEPSYHDAGQFYWGRAEAFRAGLPLFAGHSAVLVLPRHRVQDIDTLEDWAQAERMYATLVAGSEAETPVAHAVLVSR
jgi:pseudaminic acid cytidylyltransferase